MTFSSLPIFSYARRASSRSARFRPAFTMFRMRARSFATIGKTMGRAKTPSSNSRLLKRFAIAESPSITGVIGVALLPMSNPSDTSCFLKYFVFDQRDVAVHREDSVADHEDLLRPAVGLLERPFEVAHVRVAVDDPLRLREPDAVDDAAVVELVRQDRVALPRELRDEARVPGEAAHVEQGGLAALEAGDPPLQLLVQVHVPRDRAHAAAARPVGLDGLPRGPFDLRMVREVQVVVRAEHDHGLAVDLAPGRRRSLQDAELPVQALRDQVLVLRPHPGGRIPRGHRHASIGNATFPQSPLRITSIASSYRSSENLWVRRGRRFRFPLRR